MAFQEFVNCYCFNLKCEASIFKANGFAATRITLTKVLAKIHYCEYCKSELIAKPLLDIKSDINKSLNPVSKLDAFFIDDDPIFHKIMEFSLRRNTRIRHTKFSLNGAEAIEYLKANKDKRDKLPDLIFVDIHMPGMDGWDFLGELEKIHKDFSRKSKVYMTSSLNSPEHKEKIEKFSFVEGFIAKPFGINALQNLSKFECCL